MIRAFAALSLTLASAIALAADPTQIQQLLDDQSNFFESQGENVPQEVDLQSTIGSAHMNANFALIDQAEGVGEHAEITQNGTSNVAGILQGFGDDNRAAITQTGAANYAAITQSGSNNSVDALVQQGDNNSARVVQHNNDNTLSLSQYDDFNRADIEQFGGTSLNVTQTNSGGSASATNELELKAYAAPGADPNFAPVQLNGPGQTQLYVCNGDPGYCSQVLPH